jgi:nucleoside-diphosphate-sugar epimerase
MGLIMRALVTGASGFIGGHLAAELARRGYEVRALVRPTSNLRWLEQTGLTLVRGDLGDTFSLREAAAGADLVFHLAAVIHAPGWEKHRAVNVEGTENLLAACEEAAPRLQRFVFVSSISASGPSLKGRPKTEEDACRPISAYGQTKLLAEEIVRGYGTKFPVVILRPPNVLGAREREVQAVLRALQYRVKPLLGTKDKQTSFIMVEDLVEAILLCAEKKEAAGQTYHVTDGRAYSWREPLDILSRLLGRRCLPLPYGLLYTLAGLAELSFKLLGRRPPLRRSSLRSIHDHYWIFDSSKIEWELGFRPRLTLEEGLRRVVAQSGLSPGQ